MARIVNQVPIDSTEKHTVAEEYKAKLESSSFIPPYITVYIKETQLNIRFLTEPRNQKIEGEIASFLTE